MVNTKTLAAIEQSRFREIYEIFMEVEHTETTYNKVIDTVSFLNNVNSEPIDMDIVNEIFADVLQEGGGYND